MRTCARPAQAEQPDVCFLENVRKFPHPATPCEFQARQQIAAYVHGPAPACQAEHAEGSRLAEQWRSRKGSLSQAATNDSLTLAHLRCRIAARGKKRRGDK